MTERFVDEGDLDPRYFGCCDSPGLDALQCPDCGHLLVACYECNALFPDLKNLSQVQRGNAQPSTPIICPTCQHALDSEQARASWDDWTATWTGRRLVNCYPFPPGWVAGELPGMRRCDGTYCTYHYRSLPPIPESLCDETFSWLRTQPLAETHDSRWSSSQFAAQSVFDVEQSAVVDLARQAGYELPPAFLNFLFNREILTRLRSPTDCDYKCDTKLVSCGTPLGGHFLRFRSDSQDCVHWHLYLHPQFEACVVATDNLEDWTSADWNDAASRIRFCSETFLDFAIRTWLEDELWFRAAQAQPVTPEMQQYVQHYANRLDSAWSWDEDEW